MSERVKGQLKQKYSELDKEVKELTKKDRIEFVEDLASEAEEAARRQDLRTLYKITKSLNGNVSSGNCPIPQSRWLGLVGGIWGGGSSPCSMISGCR